MEKKKNKFKIFGKNSDNENKEISLDLSGIVLTPNKNDSPEFKNNMKLCMESVAFVEKVREYEYKYPFRKAIKLAIKYCLKRNIYKEYLEENSSKIMNMMLQARADYEAGIPLEESRRKFLKEFE